jgi:RNA polymerase sigma-70 factor (ECF subfamily)
VAAHGKEPEHPAVRSGFCTTRWSLIASAGVQSDEDASKAALADLCHLYWRPVFAFICRRGLPLSDAQDLTQDFFVVLLEGNLLRRANPARGRFRSLLLKSLQNFLIDAHEKRAAKKRGGGTTFVSWDDWMAEAPSQLSLSSRALECWSPERLFDVRWAATVVEHALAQLREHCASRGRRRVFDVLSGYLTAERSDFRYDDLAKTLGLKPTAVKRLVHQMRRRYRELLREEVARTVANPEEIDDELRYLCATLAAQDDEFLSDVAANANFIGHPS